MTKLQEFREAQGLSRQQLADKTGVAYSTIERIENDKFNYKAVKIGTLYDCAKALNVDLIDIIDFEKLD